MIAVIAEKKKFSDRSDHSDQYENHFSAIVVIAATTKIGKVLCCVFFLSISVEVANFGSHLANFWKNLFTLR